MVKSADITGAGGWYASARMLENFFFFLFILMQTDLTFFAGLRALYMPTFFAMAYVVVLQKK